MLSEAIFGNETGHLLFDEATREDLFPNTNCFDGVKMEPLDSEAITPEFRKAARINAMAIESNILKLIRIVGRKEIRDKL